MKGWNRHTEQEENIMDNPEIQRPWYLQKHRKAEQDGVVVML